MFKKGQLVKTKRGGQYVIVLQDENEYDEDNIVDVWGLVRKKPGFALRDNLELIGNNFKFKGVFDGGLKASFTTASNHDARADDSEGGCR
jgi:hypothetical protein|nr:MAG TPA: hypothetical protein [Caudoviricetes sp.]